MKKFWFAPLFGAALFAGGAFGGTISTDVGMLIRGDKAAEFAAELDKHAAEPEFGQEALRQAVIANAPGIVKLLLDKGVDIDAANFSGDTALHLAAKYGRLEIVNSLLAKNASVAAKENAGLTPLHAAINAKEPANRVAIVKLLLAKGADVNAASRAGLTPLMLAYSVKPFEPGLAAAIMAAKPAVNAQDNSGKSALRHCVESQSATTLNAHDEREWKIPASLADVPGVDIDLADKAGDTVIHCLAARIRDENAIPLIKHLAAKGANVNARNRLGKTPLLLALENRRPAAVKLLLELKADVNLADNDGMCPVIKAAWNGDLETLKTLIEQHGAALNVQTKSQRFTPLLYAAINKHLPVVQYLLSKNLGADQLKGALLYLSSHGGQDTAAAKMLIDNGADVNAQDFKGNTPLHNSAANKNRNLAILLLNAKADVNAVNKEGKTPLFNAAGRQDASMVELLLKNGADKAIADKKGKTAKDYAAAAAVKKMLE